MIKAAFFDIDGTILSHTQHCVPASTAEAIARLRDKGIKCVLATGRHLLELRFLPIKIKFDAYMMLNGQQGFDGDLNVIYEITFNEQALEYAVNEFNSKRIPFELVERDKMYINFIDDRMRGVLRDVSTPDPIVGEYDGGEILMATAFAGDREVELRREFSKTLKPARWHQYGIDLMPRESGGKDFGIRKFMEYYGIKREETIAFGDEDNDIDMLRFAGIGVAMGNGTDEAKTAADYITDDVDNDGISKALRHFNLI